MNRREFLKVAGVTTAVTGAAITTKPKEVFAVELGKQHDKFPVEVSEDFKGFQHQNNVFMRMFWDDSKIQDYVSDTFGYSSMTDMAIAQFNGTAGVGYVGKKGFRQVDRALHDAAWSVCQHFAPFSSMGISNALIPTNPVDPKTGEKIKDTPIMVSGLHSWDNSKVDGLLAQGGQQYKFKDTKEAAQYVKKAAKHLGADLVGIAPYNESTKRWTYTEWAKLNSTENIFPDGTVQNLPFDFAKVMEGEAPGLGFTSVKSDFKGIAGFEPKSIIVMAFEMDYDGIKTAPTLISGATAGLGYSRMSETVYKVAEFLRNLGYKAIPCGNDTSLSVPLAIEAGLGEGSRMGLLVTEKYGPRVRLAKVYTDLEIAPNKPITFGVKEFCNVCMKCADACPGKAICHEPAQVIKEGMEFDTGKVLVSTMTGVEKWFVNAERCYAFWLHSGGDCGTCIAVCPYNKIDEWHHDLSKLMTLTPFKPLLRSLDELFGYGGPIEPEARIESKYLKDAVDDFWNKI